MRSIRTQVSAAVLLPATSLIVACSALQIDVDVYKGPLVNSEEVQKDQLISMALSAKSVLYTRRNELMKGLVNDWDQCLKMTRREVINIEELLPAKSSIEWPLACRFRNTRPGSASTEPAAAPLNCTASVNADGGSKCRYAGSESMTLEELTMRDVIQINDILSFYEDTAPEGTGPALTRLRSANQRSQVASEKLKSDAAEHAALEARASSPLASNEIKEEFAAAKVRLRAQQIEERKARAAVLHAHLQLLRVTSLALADRQQRGGAERRALEELRERSARQTSQRVDPRLLACSSRELVPHSEAVSWLATLGPVEEPVNWRGDDFRIARERILARLVSANVVAALDVLDQAEAVLRQKPSRPDRCTDYRSAWSNYVGETLPEVARAPLLRASVGSADDPLPQREADARDAGSGFDSGRLIEGIDTLADDYSRQRDRATRLDVNGHPGASASDRAEFDGARHGARRAFLRLDHALLDLASRMQFLAVNQWLLRGQSASGDDTDAEKFKALLESIANNIIVHADDLRSQAVFNDRRRRSGPREFAAAAVAAQAADAPVALSRVLDAQANTDGPAPPAAAAPASAAAADRTRLQKELDALLDLALTVGPLTPDEAQRKRLDEAPQAWADDQRRIAKELGNGGPVTATAFRAELKRWLTAEINQMSTPARTGAARKRRLEGASAALLRLEPAAPPGGAASAAEAAVRRDAALSQLRLELGTGTRPRPDAAVALARKALAALPGTTTPASERAQASSSVVATKTAEGRQSPVKAPAQVPAQAPGQTTDALEAIDGVIARLRHLHLQYLLELGPDDPKSRNAAHALSAARKQREDFIYLRPASTYLRNVYAATYTQTDPGLSWDNLLTRRNYRTMQNWSDSIRELVFRGKKRGDDYTKARDALDKTYWQNINTVQLSGVGDSNFVVAKDDVGNWYVKAMGSDGSAMVRAAKKLALYNMGSSFDSNLVRADELRGQLDSARKNGGATTDIEKELQQVTGLGSGPGVAARSRTAELFQQNYTDRSRAQLARLAERLQADEFRKEIGKRWGDTFAGTAGAAALEPALNTVEAKAFHDAALAAARPAAAAVPGAAAAAASAPVAAAAGTAPGESMLQALDQLLRLRALLRQGVDAAEAPLTDTERNAVGVAQEKLKAATTALGLADLALTQEGANAERLKKAAEEAKGTERESSAQNEFLAANFRAAERLSERALRQADIEKESAALEGVQVKLAAARQRVKRAIADVDQVLVAAVERIVNDRLQLVDETETAVKVIGRNGP